MKKQMLMAAAVVSMILAGSACAGSEYTASTSSWSYTEYLNVFDPTSDADILALGGAPGTATLVVNVDFDPTLESDVTTLASR
jgi:hypothetical protein